VAIIAGTPAVAGRDVLIGVTPDTCYTVTVDGSLIHEAIAADSLGIFEFALETLPAGRHTVTLEPTGCDTTAFVICPGECGIRPQED